MTPFASLLAIPFPAIDPIALQLGPIIVRWYGLAYVAGLLLGWFYLKRLLATPRLWRDDKPPFTPVMADDLFVWVAAGVIIGGRLGHVLLYQPGHYLSNPIEILYVWQGGMAFHGGMLGTILAMWLFARRNAIPALSVMDFGFGRRADRPLLRAYRQLHQCRGRRPRDVGALGHRLPRLGPGAATSGAAL